MIIRHLRHPTSRLSAYADGKLPPALERRVAAHLAACPACRDALEEIRFGIRLAGTIPAASAPDTLWASIASGLEAGAEMTLHPARTAWRRALVFAMPALLLAAALAWYVASRPRLQIYQAPRALSGIERTAVEAHEARLLRDEPWDLRSDEAPRIRRWVEESAGLSASIPAGRPPEDAGRLRLVGARLGRIGSARAAVIGYEVDSRPVTLVTARLSDLSDPPIEGRLSKNISYRLAAAAGYKVLAWGSDGQAYAMVSELPGFGQEGCFVCHTAPDRRALIRAMHLRGD